MSKRCVNIINKLECCRNMFNVYKYCARMHNYCQTCFTDAQPLVCLLHLLTYIRLLPIDYCLLPVECRSGLAAQGDRSNTQQIISTGILMCLDTNFEKSIIYGFFDPFENNNLTINMKFSKTQLKAQLSTSKTNLKNKRVIMYNSNEQYAATLLANCQGFVQTNARSLSNKCNV